jgi:hypothetical protein
VNAIAETSIGRTHSGVQHELYQSRLLAGKTTTIDRLPWKAVQDDELECVLRVGGERGPIWARVDGNRLEMVAGPNEATFGLRNVGLKSTVMLALIALHDEVLVNGVPALRLTVLGAKDSIFVVKAGLLLYVTERFRPFVGCPTEETGLFGQECPACAIEIQAEPRTHVVTCRCGVAYHHETANTHPDMDPDDRLNCLQQTKVCLRCGKELTTEERLVWNPAAL